MAIFQMIFAGWPRVDVEGHEMPTILLRLVLVNQTFNAEATEAYLRERPFKVTILSAFPDFEYYNRLIDWGQGQVPPPGPGNFMYTLDTFRRRVSRAQPLVPDTRTVTWGEAGRFRLARTAGEFPTDGCRPWLLRAGPFIRDIQFNIIYPIPAYPPLGRRDRRLRFDFLITGSVTVQVAQPGATINTQTVMAQWPPMGLVPIGLGGAVFGIPDPRNPVHQAPFQGQCQRAGIEANRLRQVYLAAGAAPGAPGFTGFTLQDLRSIAKSFSEPAIYTIQP